MMHEVFGHYLEVSDISQEFLIIGFSPSSVCLQKRWRNNGLSANFIADYVTTFIPQIDSNTSGSNPLAELKDAVGFIANELLENAMKFSDPQSDYPINIQVHLNPDKLFFSVENSIVNSAIEPFKDYIQKLQSFDPEELYIHQVEQNLENDTSSRLGYLMMMNDYAAQIGWQFKTAQLHPAVTTVTTVVSLNI
ncbi:MAG: ATP-binding protein [Microcoleaceae cyanobacterium]